MYTVHLAKEPFKFSCSHFTILGLDHAERLHGHNYQMKVSIQVSGTDEKLGFAFDFNEVKPLIRRLCDELDERILIAAKSPYLKLKSEGSSIEVEFAGKRYVFPSEDTMVLPLVNITSEELARYSGERFKKDFAHLSFWTSLEVNVEETRGQSVSYFVRR
jgi:6-pyruvoyltetrahydropterin/6-carboxytetrahydropterin synthase